MKQSNNLIYCPNCVKLKLPHPRIFGRVLSGSICIIPSTYDNIMNNDNNCENDVFPIEIFCDKCKKYSTILKFN